MNDASLAELLRNVIARPDDHDALRVYADALIERGDPRGELIVVQLSASASDALAARERQLASELGARLAVELHQTGTVFTWRHGFLDVVDFEPVGESGPLAEAIRTLGVLPAARRLRRIVIRLVEPGWGNFGAVLAMLAKVAPQLKGLAELALTLQPRGWGRWLRPGSVGDLAPVCAAIPRLEALEVGGAQWVTLGKVAAPSLRRLVIERASSADAVTLRSMRIPGLEALELHQCEFQGWALVGLLTAQLPRLRSLRITSSSAETARELVRQLPAAPWFRGLRTLALRGIPLDGPMVDSLAARARGGGLERLELEPLPPELLERLTAALGKIVC